MPFACLFTIVSAQGQNVTLNLQNVPLQRVFIEIARQTNVSILYDESMFERMSPVSIKVKNAPISQVLDKCLENQPFSYSLNGKAIVIKKKDPSEPAKSKNISSLVTPGLKGIILNEKGSRRSLQNNENNPVYISTYASLLYKLGKTKDAIAYQEKAIQYVPQSENFTYKERLDKMKKGQKTW